MRVVVYEDNLYFIPRIEGRLTQLGHTPVSAGGREAAAEALLAGADAAVVDLHAPDALGLARDARTLGVRVIAFCGHAEIELRRKAKQAGLDVLLPNSELVSALEAVLGRAGDEGTG